MFASIKSYIATQSSHMLSEICIKLLKACIFAYQFCSYTSLITGYVCKLTTGNQTINFEKFHCQTLKLYFNKLPTVVSSQPMGQLQGITIIITTIKLFEKFNDNYTRSIKHNLYGILSVLFLVKNCTFAEFLAQFLFLQISQMFIGNDFIQR